MILKQCYSKLTSVFHILLYWNFKNILVGTELIKMNEYEELNLTFVIKFPVLSSVAEDKWQGLINLILQYNKTVLETY